MDTLLLIWRSSEGASAAKDGIIFGVYKDEKLLPTVILDTKEYYGKRFITEAVADTIELKKIEPDKKSNYPENFPPLYEFKVKGSDLILYSIDTVCAKW